MKFKFETIFVSVVGVVILAVPVMIVLGNKKIEREGVQKEAWMEKHECRADGYVAANPPRRLYRCNDGNVYIFADIPLLSH